MLGWTVIRVTWTKLRDRPDDVTGMIRAVLDRSTLLPIYPQGV
jgi:hypothetical protein